MERKRAHPAAAAVESCKHLPSSPSLSLSTAAPSPLVFLLVRLFLLFFILFYNRKLAAGGFLSLSLSRFPNGECLDLLISFEAVVVEEGEENVAYNKDFLACLNRLFC